MYQKPRNLMKKKVLALSLNPRILEEKNTRTLEYSKSRVQNRRVLNTRSIEYWNPRNEVKVSALSCHKLAWRQRKGLGEMVQGPIPLEVRLQTCLQRNTYSKNG